MQRQAIPLIIKERPTISTGLESLIIYNNEYNTISMSSGLVLYSNKKKIITHESIKTNLKIDNIKNILSKSFLTKKRKNIKVKNYNKFTRRTYKLKRNKSTIQNTSLYEKSIVKKNEWIKKNQILSDGASTIKGKLSLGKNLIVAYMTWKGYNFEDAIVVSETLVKNDLFSSIHIKKYKTFLINNETGEVR